MRIYLSHSRGMLYGALGVATALLGAVPAVAASRSTTIAVSATVVSSCTLEVTPDAAVSGIQSRCTHGEQPSIALTGNPMPPVAVERAASGTGRTILVVTY